MTKRGADRRWRRRRLYPKREDRRSGLDRRAVEVNGAVVLGVLFGQLLAERIGEYIDRK